jgi:histidyl-tRNA synthetase
MSIASSMREAGLSVMVGTAGRSLKAQMRQANSFGAGAALVIGAQELSSGTVTFRDFATGTQETLTPAEVIEKLRLRDAAPSV